MKGQGRGKENGSLQRKWWTICNGIAFYRLLCSNCRMSPWPQDIVYRRAEDIMAAVTADFMRKGRFFANEFKGYCTVRVDEWPVAKKTLFETFQRTRLECRRRRMMEWVVLVVTSVYGEWVMRRQYRLLQTEVGSCIQI